MQPPRHRPRFPVSLARSSGTYAAVTWAIDLRVNVDRYKPGAWEQRLEAEVAALSK
jgi:hypothetical protein